MNIGFESISPWLDQLEYDWSLLEHLGEVETYNLHDPIYHSGDHAQYIYIVKSGRVQLFLTTESGKEKSVAIVGKNGLIGENYISEDTTYLENTIAVSSLTLIRVPRKLFEQEVLHNPALSKQWVDILNRKLRLLAISNLQLSFGSSYSLICNALYHLAVTYGESNDEGITIGITFTHQELANLIGTSRVTVANTMNNMLQNNILSKKGRFYHIHSLDQLTDI
ncbi:Crp/Fnr family transcriptional regulator [Pontibacillus marinus]|uniref:Crp/Fnr family transcriptional regulator n=1 Tax=Pontibacillus marinus BH030004 = DSM 16465 TaxID=1385511 RepID=A0A0A5GF78_9BACI|nr:Crp/Fnr family transcriptional regulator [Pontibacillus marinus]KGX91871.1 hypothetical protein N783_00315 [Pontibacillus marinus BH030004 = DSM 16465]